MIPYIQRKSINHVRINELLAICESKNHYTNAGPVKALLEDKIGQMICLPANKRVLCVANGTIALHALIAYYDKLNCRTLRWVTPSFTFPSCLMNHSNTRVVDIDPTTYTLHATAIQDADGIIITNLFGSVVDFDVSQFPDKIVIYDNASSFMSKTEDGINICLLGDASFGSLHHTKFLGFGEGGFMVVDDTMYDDMQALCGFGFRLGARTHDVAASNYKMSDVAAAYILQHLESYDLDRHQAHQDLFRHSLTNAELFNDSSNVFYGNIPVVFKNPIEPSVFRNLGIEANKYYNPLADFPNSKNLYDRIINFPLNEDMTCDEILFICAAIDKNNL
jgi:dTDP-4-amino-4,6-dideoxygalactose transaminase